jgi:hypothetical protein
MLLEDLGNSIHMNELNQRHCTLKGYNLIGYIASMI